MSDFSKLKTISQAYSDLIDSEDQDCLEEALAEYEFSARVDVVLALIAEVEALRKEIASLKPFKFDTNETTIGYAGCVICGQYTNHGGLQCPKLVYHSLSMENQRIVPVEQIRTDHPLESVINKVYNK